MFDFLIWQQDTGISSWGKFAPLLASSSALSFPGIPVWAGIHCKVTSMWCLLIRLWMAHTKFVISLVTSVPVSKVWSVDRLSVKMTTFVAACSCVSKRMLMLKLWYTHLITALLTIPGWLFSVFAFTSFSLPQGWGQCHGQSIQKFTQLGQGARLNQ